jgi:hypothetical protein
MTMHKLTSGQEIFFECEGATELAAHLTENFPPAGDFPAINMLNVGFAIILPNGARLQGPRASHWVRNPQ